MYYKKAIYIHMHNVLETSVTGKCKAVGRGIGGVSGHGSRGLRRSPELTGIRGVNTCSIFGKDIDRLRAVRVKELIGSRV